MHQRDSNLNIKVGLGDTGIGERVDDLGGKRRIEEYEWDGAAERVKATSILPVRIQ